MSDNDTTKLASLLGLKKNDSKGYTILVSLNDSNCCKEYLYRAWGFHPPVLGHTDYYD